jgi:hypothetical protein
VGRLFRGTFKLAAIGGVIAALVVVGRKLMGGLGPQPGSPDAPKEWPSLVPDQGAGDVNSNGAAGTVAATAGAVIPEGRPTQDAPAPSEMAAPAPSEMAAPAPSELAAPASGGLVEGGAAVTGTEDERIAEGGSGGDLPA